MHAEFRLVSVTQARTFDARSYQKVERLVSGQPAASDQLDSVDAASVDGSVHENMTTKPKAGSFLRQFPAQDVKKVLAEAEARFRPTMRVQFIFEDMVKLESANMAGRPDQPLVPRQYPSVGPAADASSMQPGRGADAISTAAHSAYPMQVILAALPSTIVQSMVKVRLIQVPPRVAELQDRGSKTAPSLLAAAGGSEPQEPICLGVAKVSFDKLACATGMVRLALQPKATIKRLVAQYNKMQQQSSPQIVQSPLQVGDVTSAMQDDKDCDGNLFGELAGGSAFLTFQVVTYFFNRIPVSKLLLYRKHYYYPPVRGTAAANGGHAGQAMPDSGVASGDGNHFSEWDNPYGTRTPRSAEPNDAVASQAPSGQLIVTNRPLTQQIERQADYRSRDESSEATGSIEAGVDGPMGTTDFGSAAVRFVLIPYIALIDLVLRVHGIVMWRRPLKTLLLVLILVVVLMGDLLGTAIVLTGVLQLILFVRTTLALYRIPIREGRGVPLISVATAKTGLSAYLYDRQNVMLNALIRARLFYMQGLQEESFYEVILIFHIIRRRQRGLYVLGGCLLFATLLLSFETVVLLCLLTLLVVYPLHASTASEKMGRSIDGQRRGSRRTRSQPQMSQWLSLQTLWQPRRPMRVVRVVQVSIHDRYSTHSQSSAPSVGQPERRAALASVPPSRSSAQREFYNNVAALSRLPGASESQPQIDPALGPARSEVSGNADSVHAATINALPATASAATRHAHDLPMLFSSTVNAQTFGGSPARPTLSHTEQGDTHPLATTTVLPPLHTTQAPLPAVLPGAPLSFAVVNFQCESATVEQSSAAPPGDGAPRPRKNTSSDALRARLYRHTEAVQQLRSAIAIDSGGNSTLSLRPQPSNARLRAGNSGVLGMAGSSSSTPGFTEPGSLSYTNMGLSFASPSLTSTSSSLNLAFQRYFRETLGLLSFLLHQYNIQSYMTHSSNVNTGAEAVVRLDSLVRREWLWEGTPVDDMAMAVISLSPGSLSVMKVPSLRGCDNEARTIALLAASLLQGGSLSLFCQDGGNQDASAVIQLLSGTDRISRAPQPNPCPVDLLNVLESIWRGSAVDPGYVAEHAVITADMVLRIIGAQGSSLARYMSSTVTTEVRPSGERMRGYGDGLGGDGIATSSRPHRKHAHQSAQRSMRLVQPQQLDLQPPLHPPEPLASTWSFAPSQDRRVTTPNMGMSPYFGASPSRQVNGV